MENWPFVITDVFTSRPLAGNQLGVFTDARPIPERLLIPLARELNFAETVFVYPPTADGDARIRIFMPTGEIPFAGRPVIGTAHVLATGNSTSTIRLETGIGTVPVQIEREDERPRFGWMTQPVPQVVPLADSTPILAALGVQASVLPVTLYDNGMTHLYVNLPTEDAVAALDPDLRSLASAMRPSIGPSVGGVNCFAGAGSCWKTRMFAPAAGVAEDAATGSAAGPLAAHLLRHGVISNGDLVEISQGPEIGRPSTLFARVSGTSDNVEQVEVGGSSITVAHGQFDATVLTA